MARGVGQPESWSAGMAKPEFLVITSARNEGPFLLEWVAYWRTIGADALLIFSHDCDDGSDLLLDRLAALGLVIHEKNEVLKRGPHRSALKHAVMHPLYEDANWAIAAQVHEFPAIRARDGGLRDLVARHADKDCIRLPSRLFSHGGQITMRDDLCMAMFTEAEHEAHRGPRRARALFRPASDPVRIGPHGPVYAKENPARIVTLEASFAQVNDYPIRSIDSLAVARHMASQTDTDALCDWQARLRRTIRDRGILRHLDAVVALVGQFRDDPILRHLHDACFEWHSHKAALLRGQPDYRAINTIFGTDPAPAIRASLPSPKRHANRRKMLTTLQRGARCAEIGVWNGDFSQAILEVTEPEELVLIDPWELIAQTPRSEQTHRRHCDRDFMFRMGKSVADRYAGLPNVTIRKGFSQDVLASYPDNYFDWVYIDGNHLYEFVKRDVDMSFRKVRTGGTIAGDDFTWEKDGRAHVRDGVMDALAAQGRKDEPRTMGQQYLITVNK